MWTRQINVFFNRFDDMAVVLFDWEMAELTKRQEAELEVEELNILRLLKCERPGWIGLEIRISEGQLRCNSSDTK